MGVIRPVVRASTVVVPHVGTHDKKPANTTTFHESIATTPEPVPTRASVPAQLTRPTPASGTRAAVGYGPQPYQLLDLHLPDRDRFPGLVPVIVYLHSGGWVSGSRANVPAAALAQIPRGYAVASVDYRLAATGGKGSFPEAVYDVKRAIRFLKANAGTWGLDPSRVIVMGESAGGHLAALTGASAARLEPTLAGPLATVDSTVAAIVDIVGITDLATFVSTPHPWAVPLADAFLGCPSAGGRSGCTHEQLRLASVTPYVGPANPPIFMAYGGEDTLVVPALQGRPLAQAWAAAHGSDPHAVVYDLVPTGGHNLSTSELDMTALDEFLDRAAGGPALATKRVVLYGDSLAWESRNAFSAALAGVGITEVTTRTFGGTAICDWFAQMRADDVALHPDAVVIEFSGNALTPCMKYPSGLAIAGLAYLTKYAADARTALGIFAPGGSLVYFAGSPISRRASAAHDPTTSELHAIYASVAASSPLGRYVDAGAAVTDHGAWTPTLPCLGGEPCTGGRDASGTPVNVVRSPDGAHFCPGAPPAVGGVTSTCPVWSGGAWRFGTAMADPIPLDLSSARSALAATSTR
jgi:acetyl esterase/lipase